jgi:hypothetical protein
VRQRAVFRDSQPLFRLISGNYGYFLRYVAILANAHTTVSMPLVAFAAVLFASSTARVVLSDNDMISLTTNVTSVPTAGAWVQVRWVASQTAHDATITQSLTLQHAPQDTARPLTATLHGRNTVLSMAAQHYPQVPISS